MWLQGYKGFRLWSWLLEQWPLNLPLLYCMWWFVFPYVGDGYKLRSNVRLVTLRASWDLWTCDPHVNRRCIFRDNQWTYLARFQTKTSERKSGENSTRNVENCLGVLLVSLLKLNLLFILSTVLATYSLLSLHTPERACSQAFIEVRSMTSHVTMVYRIYVTMLNRKYFYVRWFHR